MSGNREALEKAVDHALSGKDAHVGAAAALEGLDWKAAGIRPEGAPYSIFQLLNHMIYWQEWVLSWLDGQDPSIPEQASGSWPGGTGPADSGDWEQAVGRFASGLEKLSKRARSADLLSKRASAGSGKSPMEVLQTIGSHNSYHLGQVVLLRQLLGAWPPPQGGHTW